MKEETVRISLNGEPKKIPEGLSVLKLIESLGLNEKSIAVGRNKNVIPRSEHSTTTVRSGDQIDIVHFVQGG